MLLNARQIEQAMGKERIILLAIEDITERKRLEQRLAASELRYRRAFETATDAILLVEKDRGTVVAVNPSVSSLLGYTEAESVGRTLPDLGILPDLDDFSAILQELEVNGILNFDSVPLRTKAGSLVTSDIYIVDKADVAQCNVRDVTDSNLLAQELLNRARLESIGVLAAGIAHDLNNFLAGIIGNIGLAQVASHQAERDECLVAAEQSAFQVRDLALRLLTFAQGGQPVMALADLGALTRESTDLALSGSAIDCEFHMPDDTYFALVDAGQMRQVITNLVINAEQAMPGGGKLKVSAENIELGSGDSIPLLAGRYIKLSVEDEGVGIPAVSHKRVFDAFFSTKSKGSGLGLATTYAIINNHSGYITFKSEVGVGTCFDFYLPASQLELPQQTPADILVPLTREWRILAMDDDEQIRVITTKLMSRLGYKVVTCENGAEAIKKYSDAMASGQPFHAVTLDLTIRGGMGGVETMEQLKKIDPDVAGIAASGYSDNPVMANFQDYGFKGAMAKPYRVNDLDRLLREVLGEG